MITFIIQVYKRMRFVVLFVVLVLLLFFDCFFFLFFFFESSTKMGLTLSFFVLNI